jgi:hypothetical protein
VLDILIWETSKEFFNAMFCALGGWSAESSQEADDAFTYCAGGEL